MTRMFHLIDNAPRHRAAQPCNSSLKLQLQLPQLNRKPFSTLEHPPRHFQNGQTCLLLPSDRPGPPKARRMGRSRRHKVRHVRPQTPTSYAPATTNTPHSKAYSEYFDPCQEAADKSIRCLKRNGGERAMCVDFFQAYRDCKEQWQHARKEARKNQGWFG